MSARDWMALAAGVAVGFAASAIRKRIRAGRSAA